MVCKYKPLKSLAKRLKPKLVGKPKVTLGDKKLGKLKGVLA